MWNRFSCEISLVISCEILSHVKCHMWFHVKSFHMWNVTCDFMWNLSHVKCHMWFHVKSFHMWNVTCDFMWNPFICEISHVISCEIFSHVTFHIRSHNFTCYHMISHEITRVNSCGFFVRGHFPICHVSPAQRIHYWGRVRVKAIWVHQLQGLSIMIILELTSTKGWVVLLQ
jgi:hypothetical protein